MLVKVKSNLYWDFHSGIIDTDIPTMYNPEYKYGKDFDLIAADTLLMVSTRKEYFGNIHEQPGWVLHSDEAPFNVYIDDISWLLDDDSYFEEYEE